MSKLLDGAVELLEFDRLLDDRDRADLEDLAEDFAVGVAGDDDDGEVGVKLLQAEVDFIAGHVRELQIEENEVELLLFRKGNGFRAGSDHDAAKARFLQELLENRLEGGVVIDHEDGRLTGAFGFEHIPVEQAALDAPTAPDLDGGKLSALDEIINSRERNAQIFCGFLHGHQFWRFESHNFQKLGEDEGGEKS